MLQDELDPIFAIIAGAIIAVASMVLVGGIMFVAAGLPMTVTDLALVAAVGVASGVTTALAMSVCAWRYWRSTESRD
ncbi:hypothetical protein SAMN04488061_2889 [Filomicrobium insigne]|uniref:Uncharacterized protein n=1 Tax=Filomicrobium insigne TaxID=418854 RepID=A0A1H0SGE6_9HYPH|nr:hypothetical protein [Filomicrobium insigne]SDP40881.1 hypothetical protein SAMN04488061_2889 [Filomicrobium insigne]